MEAIELTGRITETGNLEVKLPEGLTPGPVRIKIEAIDPDQAWFWSPDWQAQEHKVDQEIASGQYKDFSTLEEFIDDLMNDDDE